MTNGHLAARLSVQRPLTYWALAMGLLCLSLAVFNWGLQYKMSLYQNINGIVHAPAAKLWMGKDGASTEFAKVPLPEPAPLLVQATLLIVFLALYLALRDASAVRTLMNWRRRANFSEIRLTPLRQTFLFRPPPSIV